MTLNPQTRRAHFWVHALGALFLASQVALLLVNLWVLLRK